LPPPRKDLPAGYRLLALDSIDSTNAEALRRIESGESEGLIITAIKQTRGYGRRGREWVSGTGNLHASLILQAPPPAQIGQLSFVTAVAAINALTACVSDASRLGLKWPNDLLLDGRKLGGILIEGGGEHCVIGLGVNVAHAPLSTSFEATSLQEAGADITAEALLIAFCHDFDARLRQWRQSGFSGIRREWLRWAAGLGKPLVARFPDGTSVGGVFRDIDETGALILALEGGAMRSIGAGEVFFETEVEPDASRD
jgi:BirA family biotin operon repressor/biotin-[acetyl-CoA-carboxylase] ligase